MTMNLATAHAKTGPRVARLAMASAAAMLLLAALASVASAMTPVLSLYDEVAPTNLAPGKEGDVAVVVSNLGDAPVEEAPVTITNVLPAGLKAIAVTGAREGSGEIACPTGQPLPTPLRCTFNGVLNPYERLTITVQVKVAESLSSSTTVRDLVTAEGGGANTVTRSLPVTISNAPTPFGIAQYEVTPLNEDGTPATSAGSQPFQLTTTFVADQNAEFEPVAQPKDLSFNLPPGLVGNPDAVPRCSEADFAALVLETNLCPPDTVVGAATVAGNEPITLHWFSKTVPVFNLVPGRGEPARFGIAVIGEVPVIIDTAVSTEGDYHVIATVHNATQTAGVLSSQVTLWGIPGDARHDDARGWECVAGGIFDSEIDRSCPTEASLPATPFLRSPTSCAQNPAQEPVTSQMEADSWTAPEAVVTDSYTWMTGEEEPLGFDACGQLSLTPRIAVASEQHTASTPTGLNVSVKIPQSSWSESERSSQPDLRDATVTLPQGAQLSPSAANGLEGCSEEEVEGGVSSAEHERFKHERVEQLAGASRLLGSDPLVFPDASAECPAGSKVGTVRIKTPLLSHELEGSVYLASPAPNGEAGRNPFNSLVALYLVAEDEEAGILVKLAGEGEVDEATGQVTTTFSNGPQVPFEELKLELFGGPRASLATPARCGSYAASAVFTPWSGTGPVDVESPGGEFAVDSGVEGSGCPGGALPFNPGFVAKNTNTGGGGFTGFELELSRPDGDQALGGVTMHLPAGVAALLSSVELCSEGQADATACPAGSLVGEATAVAGLGSQPYVQRGGRVYITGPYDGAPFGLDIVTPADAGPFNLGYISVRSKLEVNPENASVTVESDPLPTEIRGIPLQLKRVLVDVNRDGFEFNPTDCGTPLSVQGTITGAEGASWNGSSPYPVTGCSSLPFGPALTAGAVGRGSKADGTTFKVIVTSGGVGPGGVVQAGIAKVDLQLPKQLSSRLPTLQKACTEAAFNSNPASCSEGSVIGQATIHTPVLKSPLSGPAYLVSHGNAAFPDVEFVLQGEGIKLVLDGKTQIKSGITYSKFETTPDAPFTTFETVLPAGPHGVLTANVAESKHFDLCGENLQMPTTIIAQNGARIERDTKIAIEGCTAVKANRAKKLTRAQLLAKALQACRKQYRHEKHARLRCEKQARKHHAAKKANKHKKLAKKAKRKG